MQNSFSYERFRTQTRFETEARENSEIAYCFRTCLYIIFAANPVRRFEELRGDPDKEPFCILGARRLEQNQKYD